jgi:hypothetical protein
MSYAKKKAEKVEREEPPGKFQKSVGDKLEFTGGPLSRKQ